MNGTQLAYYFVCKRKLWLFANQISMEQNSEFVALGKFISENTYEREKHEIQISGEDGEIVLDFYDSKRNVIHEVKKSDKLEETHVWQVKYYISVLEEKGIFGATGEIDYPKLRQKISVELTEKDRIELKEIKRNIREICENPSPPNIVDKPFCKNCAYYELCYI